MLFFHMLLSNFDAGDAHPYRNAIVHWLACFACQVALFLAVFLAFLLLGFSLSISR